MRNSSSFVDAGSDGNVTDEDSIHMTFVSYMEMIFIPLIVAVGLIGNTISAVIFFNQKLRKISCSLYLAAKAVVDSGFLICLLVSWFAHINWPLIHTPGICQLQVFVSYLCGFLSVWFIVWVTIENFFRICRPFNVSKFCTVSKARCVISVTTLTGVIVYSFSTWTNGIVAKENGPVCFMIAKFEIINTVLIYSDCIISLALPSIVVILTMSRVVYAVLKSYRTKNTGTSNGSGKLQTKVTRMLLWVSVTFLVLNLPSHIVRLRAIFILISQQTTNSSPTFFSIQRTLQMIYYLSFAVNFFIYITMGKSFREIFLEIFCRPCPFSFFSRHQTDPTSAEIIPLQEQVK